MKTIEVIGVPKPGVGPARVAVMVECATRELGELFVQWIDSGEGRDAFDQWCDQR